MGVMSQIALIPGVQFRLHRMLTQQNEQRSGEGETLRLQVTCVGGCKSHGILKTRAIFRRGCRAGLTCAQSEWGADTPQIQTADATKLGWCLRLTLYSVPPLCERGV